MTIDKDSPDGLKLAYLFWSSIGKPKAFANLKSLEAWAPRMDKLARKVSLPYSEFRWFIVWATRLPDKDGAPYGNTWTAENLRTAKDPMLSLEKQFATTYYEVLLPKANIRINLLRDRVQREMDERSRSRAPKAPVVTWHDVLVDKDNPKPWQIEKARHMTALDERFPMLYPAPGESMDQFVDRLFTPFAVWRDWRCSKCEYGVGDDGDMDERVKWCGDCWEEIWMNIEDDLEMLMEIPTVSDLTREWPSECFVEPVRPEY